MEENQWLVVARAISPSAGSARIVRDARSWT